MDVLGFLGLLDVLDSLDIVPAQPLLYISAGSTAMPVAFIHRRGEIC